MEQSSSPHGDSARWFHWQAWLVCAALVAAVAAIYGQTYDHEFIQLDDPEHVATNPMIVNGLSWESVQWAFTHQNAGFWLPLTWISHMIDWELVDSPGSHHLINVGWHAANCVLLFWLLLRMTGRLWPSALVAALFAVHPLQVESVAWACERKNTLCMFFSLICLLVYVGYARRGGWWRYVIVVLTLAASLMAKPMSVTLPCVMLLLDYWPLARFQRVDWRHWLHTNWKPVVDKLPMFALIAVICVVTFQTQYDSGAVYTVDKLSLSARIKNTFCAYTAYVALFAWPSNLAVLYHHTFDAITWKQTIASAFGLTLVTAGVVALRKRAPYLLVGWFWYLGTLVPMIGLLQVGNQSMADRFSYLPHIGLMIALAWGLADLAQRYRAVWWGAVVAVPVVLVAFGMAAWSYTSLWQNSTKLFEYCIRVADNPLIRNNLGVVLSMQGKHKEAEQQYLKAIEQEERFAEAYYNVAQSYAHQKRYPEAAQYYDYARQVKPGYRAATVELGNMMLRLQNPADAIEMFEEGDADSFGSHEALNNYGVALAQLGRDEEAIERYLKSVEINPEYADAWNNLAQSYTKLGRYDDALDAIERALTIDPGLATARNSYGMWMAQQDRFAEAVEQYRQAIELDHDYVEAHYNLGNALLRQGLWENAAEYYRQTLELDPKYVRAWMNLGAAHFQLGNFELAIEAYRGALEQMPELTDVHVNLGNAYIATQRFHDAELSYRQALEQNPQHPDALVNIAVALAAQGRKDEAREAIVVAEKLLPTDAPQRQRIAALMEQL